MKLLKPHLLSLGTTIGIVIAIGLLSYRDWHTSDELTQSADHARTVINQTSELMSWLKDAESGQRGYLLTGDDRYLAPYVSALPEIDHQLQELASSTAGSPPAATEAVLSGLARQKLGELARTVELSHAGKLPEAMAMVRTNIGKATMDRIRTTAGELVRQEDEELDTRLASARARASRTRMVVLGGTALLALLMLGAVVHVSWLIASLERANQLEYARRATLRTTLESIGDAVIATDADSTITFLNPVAERACGWPADMAIGRPLSDIFRIVSEETRERLDNPVEKVLRAGVVVGLANHTLLIQRGGAEVPIDDSGAPIRDRGGKMTGVVLVFRDVSDRRRQERALAESAERYRLLFENNPQPMWVYEQATRRFLAVNNAAVESYGYTREEFLGMTLDQIRAPEDGEPAQAAGLRGDPVRHHRRKDGTAITAEATEHPLVFDGRDACLVLAIDVTERKRLEEQFQQSQKLESIGRLAGGVAHDFNNLLTVINGYAEMLLADMETDDPNREGLNEIRAAGERASGLTQQLLAFSRRQIVKPAVVNLNAVVGDMRRMLRRLIPEDIEIASNLAEDLGNIKADTGQLQQIVMNLAVNARDAMPAGGKLLIETANAVFDDVYASQHGDTRPGAHVMLAVSDTGSGMTAEVRNRIFEPFFTTKPTGGGTGLGLATVYGMVKQSGGWIWVYSEPGVGTTFKIYFPRTDLPLAPAAERARAAAGGSETILVVEDQAEVRNLAVSALRQRGYTVYSAADGAGGTAFSRQFAGTIHLLLTDVIMPGMTGRELAERLKGERPELRVLFMSGYTADAIAQHGVLETGIEYLQKPFTPDVLAVKVREVLGKKETEDRRQETE